VINATMCKESSNVVYYKKKLRKTIQQQNVCAFVIYSSFINGLVSSVGDSESTLSLFLSLWTGRLLWSL